MYFAYQLDDGTAFCITNGQTIFLDIAKNRYFSLSPSLDAVFQRLITENSTDHLRSGDWQRLERAGVFSAEQACSSITRLEIQSAQQELSLDEPSPGFGMASCVFTQAMVSMRTHRKTLAWLPRSLQRRRMTMKSELSAFSWTSIARAFSTTAPLRPRAEHCLTSSIAFLFAGLTRNLDAQLVFGVHSAPFTAHCWVQANDTVLNDRLEKVRTFTPILVL